VAGNIFLVNIGVNSSHSANSPIFPDGTFELVPIPEDSSLAGGSCRTYADLSSYNVTYLQLTYFLPKNWENKTCHNDPDFESFTYGDNCDSIPKAFGLRSAAVGDFIFFLARLGHYKAGVFSGIASFYLVGYLVVDRVFKSLYQEPTVDILSIIKGNAHVQRALHDPDFWNGFWVFQGSAQSKRFKHAVPFTLEFAAEVLRQADGSPWTTSSKRSELQIIGSYTRTARCVINTHADRGIAASNAWWQMVSAYV
jgi:hypothetical protein